MKTTTCNKLTTILFTGALAATLVAFPFAASAAEKPAKITKAIAVLQPTKGSKVKGTVIFTKVDDGVRVKGTITGLTPGKHGFHIHEYGDLSSTDGSSLGGHFNPTTEPHAAPEAPKHHTGDFGNITADSKGVAKFDEVFKGRTLNGPKSIIGRGVVVHAKADDLTSQPSGAAGARIAVGVVGVANPK